MMLGLGRVKGSQGTGAVLFGEKELRRKLGRLGTTAPRRVIRSGMSAAMTVMAKEVRKQVNATSVNTPHASSLKRGARKAVGKRFRKSRKGAPLDGVVGFGVGRKGAKRSEVLSSGTAKGKKALHVTAKNIHWFVLGATIFGNRKMPAFFKNCVPNALAAAGEPAMARAVQKCKERLLKEARKR